VTVTVEVVVAVAVMMLGVLGQASYVTKVLHVTSKLDVETLEDVTTELMVVVDTGNAQKRPEPSISGT